MRTKRCILIFLLFIFVLSISVLIVQKNDDEFGSNWKSDRRLIRNRLQARNLLKTMIKDGTLNENLKRNGKEDWSDENVNENDFLEKNRFFENRFVKNRFFGKNREVQDDSSMDKDGDFLKNKLRKNYRFFIKNRHIASDIDRFRDRPDQGSIRAELFMQNPVQPTLLQPNYRRLEEIASPINIDPSKIDRSISTSPSTVPSTPTNPAKNRQEPTIVTAIFDIGRGNWNQYKRPYSMYQDYMKRLLTLDINLVIFADPEGAKFVREHRKSKMHKTKIQEMAIQQLPLYVHFPQVKNLIDKEQANWKSEWDHSMQFHPESISPEYDILMNSKPYFVYYVANWNPFNSEYFYWVDAGYGHGRAPYPSDGASWAPENLMTKEIGEKITFIQLGPGDIKRYTMKEMYRQGLTIINGGFFGGNKNSLSEYYHLHNRVFENLLNRGYVDDDQTLTVLCYHEKPELFNMVVGDWYDVFRLFRMR